MQSTAESLYDAQREEKHEKIESNERSRVPNRAGQGQRDGVEACMNMHESVHNITPPYVNGGEKERERPPIYPLLPFSPLSQPDEPAFTFIYISVHLSHVDASWTRHPSLSNIYFIFFYHPRKRKSSIVLWSPCVDKTCDRCFCLFTKGYRFGGRMIWNWVNTLLFRLLLLRELDSDHIYLRWSIFV